MGQKHQQKEKIDTMIQKNQNKTNPITEASFKVAVIGDTGVGKTSIMTRYVNDTFEPDLQDFKYISKTSTYHDVHVTITFCDLNYISQRIYKNQLDPPNRGCRAYLMAFDLTNRESFENIVKWNQEIERYAPENIKKLIIGNKVDLENQRVVTSEEFQKLANDLKSMYRETSALSSVGINEAIEQLIIELIALET